MGSQHRWPCWLFWQPAISILLVVIKFCSVLFWDRKGVAGRKWVGRPERCRTSDHRRDHISPVLRQLHWLPVRQRVQFKLAVLVFKAMHGQAPQCLTDDCQLVAAAGRRQLRSSDAVTCIVPRTCTCLGDRAFGVAGPRLWNVLPISLRQPDLDLPLTPVLQGCRSGF